MTSLSERVQKFVLIALFGVDTRVIRLPHKHSPSYAPALAALKGPYGLWEIRDSQ